MWSYLMADFFINPLPGYVESVAGESESLNAEVLERYFPFPVAFDKASACVCPQRKMPGWKQPTADAIRSKGVVH
jgi:hypothetical protein